MWIPIFKAGTHRSMEGVERQFTEADLDQMVTTYNDQPEDQKRKSPHVLGHPDVDSPAYGWVEELKREGNTLLAWTDDFVEEFKESVNKGLYKFRSASFYPNGLLRHVGWLGATQPAVAGLGEVSFSEDEEGVVTYADAFDWTVEDAFRDIGRLLTDVREYFIEKHGRDEAEKMLPSWKVDYLKSLKLPERTESKPKESAPSEAHAMMYAEDDTIPEHPTTEISMSQEVKEPTTEQGAQPNAEVEARMASFAEENTALRSEVDQQKQENEALRARLSRIEEDRDRERFTNFCEKLVAENKMLPADVEYHVSDLMAKRTISFSEGEESMVDKTMKHLASKEPHTLTTRVATKGGASDDAKKKSPAALSFASAVGSIKGVEVDDEAMERFERASAYAEEHGVSLAEAAILIEQMD